MHEYPHAQVLAERLLRRCIHVARDRSHARWFRDYGRCRWTALDLRSPLTSNGAGSSNSALGRRSGPGLACNRTWQSIIDSVRGGTNGVLLKMEVGIRKGAWRRVWRYPAYLWSLRWIYAVQKTRRLVYGVYPRIPPIHHWGGPFDDCGVVNWDVWHVYCFMLNAGKFSILFLAVWLHDVFYHARVSSLFSSYEPLA